MVQQKRNKFAADRIVGREKRGYLLILYYVQYLLWRIDIVSQFNYPFIVKFKPCLAKRFAESLDFA